MNNVPNEMVSLYIVIVFTSIIANFNTYTIIIYENKVVEIIYTVCKTTQELDVRVDCQIHLYLADDNVHT